MRQVRFRSSTTRAHRGAFHAEGHCGVTSGSSITDCTLDSAGSWGFLPLHVCINKCAVCSRCGFVSHSTVFQDCSWYAECDKIIKLKPWHQRYRTASYNNFTTFKVKDASPPTTSRETSHNLAVVEDGVPSRAFLSRNLSRLPPIPCREDFAAVAEHVFKKTGRAAEVGVFRGLFSRHNLATWSGEYWMGAANRI